MTYEVKIPMLLEAADAARAVIAGVQGGTMEVKEGAVINGASSKLISVVATDAKVRSVAAKIAAQEAKLIEQSGSQKQIAA